MALPKIPISTQLSPSTYLLLMKLIDLCVEDDGSGNARFKTNVQARIETLFTDLIALTANAGTKVTPADLSTLLTDGLAEASAINKNGPLVLPC